MMPMNLKDYVKIYDDFLDKNTCNVTVDKLNKAEWELHKFYHPANGELKSYDKELSVAYAFGIEETQYIQRKIWFALEQYILKDFAYMEKWFSGWNSYTQLRYNRYEPDTQMKLHCDHIHSIFDGMNKGIPILSILGSLNDDYEGGELVFWESETIKLKAGSIMIFPSNFMYPHKVMPVTKGTRYSYVSWAW